MPPYQNEEPRPSGPLLRIRGNMKKIFLAGLWLAFLCAPVWASVSETQDGVPTLVPELKEADTSAPPVPLDTPVNDKVAPEAVKRVSDEDDPLGNLLLGALYQKAPPSVKTSPRPSSITKSRPTKGTPRLDSWWG